MIIALLPAHNEGVGIAAAVESLHQQTRTPDRIVVVADNCTDNTVREAMRAGASVFVTRGNKHKKAGALNQYLSVLLPTLSDDDVILVQDADSFLDPRFIESGITAYTTGVGGVGGVFRGRVDGSTFWSRIIQNFQTNEYARYELDIRRQRGRVLVLTGTATLLRVGVLREVIQARRDGILPGEPQVYDTKVLTEDNELSFGLLKLGYKIMSPKNCTLTTETMPSLRTLAQQRLRWKRGALENCMDYGWIPTTRGYWCRQALGFVGVLITAIYVATLVYGISVGMTLHPFWLGVTALFGLERVVTVRRRGWKQMLLAGTVFIEFLYDCFLQAVQAIAYFHVVTNKTRNW